MDIPEQGLQIVEEFKQRIENNVSAVTNNDRRYSNAEYMNYGIEINMCDHKEFSNGYNEDIQEQPCCNRCRCSINDAIEYSKKHEENLDQEQLVKDEKTVSDSLLSIMNKYIPPAKGENCVICGGKRVFARLPCRLALPNGVKRKEEFSYLLLFLEGDGFNFSTLVRKTHHQL